MDGRQTLRWAVWLDDDSSVIPAVFLYVMAFFILCCAGFAIRSLSKASKDDAKHAAKGFAHLFTVSTFGKSS